MRAAAFIGFIAGMLLLPAGAPLLGVSAVVLILYRDRRTP
jgi:hypothetical protein